MYGDIFLFLCVCVCVCVCECHHFSLCAETVSCDGRQDSSGYHSDFCGWTS